MTEQPIPTKPPFRFGLRALLMIVTVVALIAGLIPFVPMFLAIFAGAFAVQCLAFLLILRSVVWITGVPASKPEVVADVDATDSASTAP